MSETEMDKPEHRSAMAGTRKAAILLGLAAVFNLSGNVGFHVLAAHKTNVSTYGLIATLLSLGFLASAIGAGLQYAVARHAAQQGRDPRGVLLRSLWSCGPLLLAVAAATAIAAPLAGYLKSSSTAIDATLLYFVVTIVSALPIGVLMAQRRFGVLATTTAVGSAARFLFAVLMGIHNNSEVVALMSSTYATVLIAGMNTAVVVFRRIPGEVGTYRHEPRGAVRAEGTRLAILGACLWATWLFSLTFARHYLTAAAAGHFSVASISGSSLLYLAAPIATAYFPAILRSRSKRAALAGLMATAVVALVGAGGLALFGPLVFRNIYGQGYPPSHLLFLEMGISAAWCSIASYVLWTSRTKERIPPGITVGVLTALAIEVLLGSFGGHGQSFLALSPMVSISLGGVAGLAAYRLFPAKEHEVAVHQPQGDLTAELVGTQAEITADAPSLLPYLTVGVMACDEELTIRQCLSVLLDETQNGCKLGQVIVVASGSTDGTRQIVGEIAATDSRVTLIEEPSRTGKVNAINLYLASCDLPLAGLVNADVVLAPGALSLMADRFRNGSVGMVGGRPVPQNQGSGVCDRLVRLEWQLHDTVARRNPKLGEAVLFRRVFPSLRLLGTADEVAIEALLLDGGYELAYVPEAVVYNHGPTKLGDYVRHRRRIHSGHIIQQKWDGYTPATMRSGVVAVGIADAVRRDKSVLKVLPFALAAEVYIRATTVVSIKVSKNLHHMNWEPIQSAKRALPATPVQTPEAPVPHVNGYDVAVPNALAAPGGTHHHTPPTPAVPHHTAELLSSKSAPAKLE
ncbi:MAG TPA: glycosyltransferase [Acidimicrobiales bacterium]|nr:glycosyltransferase [Acidimicrobiales bacterium]